LITVGYNTCMFSQVLRSSKNNDNYNGQNKGVRHHYIKTPSKDADVEVLRVPKWLTLTSVAEVLNEELRFLFACFFLCPPSTSLPCVFSISPTLKRFFRFFDTKGYILENGY